MAVLTYREWQELQKRLSTGQAVRIETGSPLYKGPYRSEILAFGEEGIRLQMPLESGHVVLIPVGTLVDVYVDEGDLHFQSKVIERRAGRERYVLLYVPVAEERALPPPMPRAPVLAVTSGKGGVGKSTFVVNIGLALTQLGKRVCIIDADLGTANIDVLLNLAPPFNLSHVLDGSKHMVEVLVEGPGDLLILPGGSGMQRLTRLDDTEFRALIEQFRELERFADIVLIDTASGVSPEVTNFVSSASAALVITAPEPHAITDAYALMKVLSEGQRRVPLQLVVNRVGSVAEADSVTRKMGYAAKRFLDYELEPLGHVSEDAYVTRAVRRQVPVVSEYPRSRAAQDFQRIAAKLVDAGEATAGLRRFGGVSGFLRRMRSLWPARDDETSVEEIR